MRTANPRSRTSRTSAIVLSMLLAAAVSLSSACSSGGSKPGAKMEQKKLRVGIVKDELGALPIWTGVDNAAFSKAGLDVSIVSDYATDEEALKALKDEKVDIVYCDYARAIEAKSLGAFRISLVAEGYVAGPGSVNLVQRSGASATVADDVHKAFNAKGGILVPTTGEPDAELNFSVPALMLVNALPAVGADLGVDKSNKTARLKQEFQNQMADRLTAHVASSAVMAEPFWTEAESSNSLSVLLDLTTGDNEGMPLGGYFAQQDFALKNVNTLKVFTQALNTAKSAASSRATATVEMIKHYGGGGMKIATTVASNVIVGSFPQTVNANRLQRVLDAMQKLGLAPFFDLNTLLPPNAIR